MLCVPFESSFVMDDRLDHSILDVSASLFDSCGGQACDSGILPPNMSAALMQEAMTPIEWSVLKATLNMFREAGSEEALEFNGLTITSLASVLAEIWFSPMSAHVGAGAWLLAPYRKLL